jgi:membrane associated rhomboid family serine protease
MSQAPREPVFNVPGIVIAMVAAFAAVHFGREMLSARGDEFLVDMLAFNPSRYSGEGRDLAGGGWAAPVTFVSHAFLHGDFMHLAINSAWFLAVGTPIARRMSTLSFLAFFALCAAGGALLFLVIHPGLDASLVGASGAISGLMAAALRLMFAARTDADRALLREDPATAPALSAWAALTQPGSRGAIIAWVIVNFVAAVAMGAAGSGGPIAWEAHLGGFFTGLFAFDLFDRGPREQSPI